MASGNNISLAEMRKIIEEEKKAATISETTSPDEAPVGSDWNATVPEESPENPEVEPESDDEDINTVSEEPEAENKPYTGPGLVIDKNAESKNQVIIPREYTGITPTTQNAIDDYLKEMDDAIERVQAENEQFDADQGDDEQETKKTSEEEFMESYNEAVVVIDKMGMGTVIDFTDEEREKLTRAKTIKLEEVETVPIKTYATKKVKPKDKDKFDSIIKNINNLNTTPICLPLSGYTATIKGCTAYELMNLLETGSNALIDAQTKWSLIHSKIQSTSLGDMSFNEFLFNTASSDYNNFIYGILCATYPDIDNVSIKCPECKGTYQHNYAVRELIRAERMNDKLKEQFAKIIDASVSETTAKAVHEASPIKTLKAIKLPISGIIVEIQVQSAYDLINNSIKSISTENADDTKYSDATILSTLVRRALVPDPDDPDVPYEITEASDIAKLLYQLRERDILIIRKFGDDLMGGMTIEYGFMNMKCPRCGRHIETQDVDPERLLFQRYRQELNASIE